MWTEVAVVSMLQYCRIFLAMSSSFGCPLSFYDNSNKSRFAATPLYSAWHQMDGFLNLPSFTQHLSASSTE
jgi:hypothetical protein